VPSQGVQRDQSFPAAFLSPHPRLNLVPGWPVTAGATPNAVRSRCVLHAASGTVLLMLILAVVLPWLHTHTNVGTLRLLLSFAILMLLHIAGRRISSARIDGHERDEPPGGEITGCAERNSSRKRARLRFVP
jgi:hypothetical protein